MQVLVTLIVVGVLLWLVNSFIPMARSIKSIFNAVVIIVVVVWLLNALAFSSPSGIFELACLKGSLLRKGPVCSSAVRHLLAPRLLCLRAQLFTDLESTVGSQKGVK
jgi:hypothetical protein